MLATVSRPQFVSKIIADKYGRNFRLTFFVSIIDGQIKGRLVSAEPLVGEDRHSINGGYSDSKYLPAYSEKKEAFTEYVSAYAPVVSPYSSLIYFVSQPTRAPSVK